MNDGEVDVAFIEETFGVGQSVTAPCIRRNGKCTLVGSVKYGSVDGAVEDASPDAGGMVDAKVPHYFLTLGINQRHAPDILACYVDPLQTKACKQGVGRPKIEGVPMMCL